MIPLPVTDEDYAAAVRSQRELLCDLAERIERGEALSTRDSSLAASALRKLSTMLTEHRPRPPGQAPKMNHGELALEFAALRSKRIGINRAHEDLAERHCVSVTAVKEALKKYGPAALELYRVLETYRVTKNRE